MSIAPGRYCIQSCATSDHFVGTGPVPPVYPPFPAPLRSVRDFMKDVFDVMPMGDGTYRVKTHELWVGYDEDNNVKLIYQKPVAWEAKPCNGR
ncbi:hypothetical protein FRC06_010912, partial [Ceratobasidium sp. 370]